MAFYTRPLPYQIASAATRYLRKDLRPSEAFLKAGEEYSPEVYVSKHGRAEIKWWPATPEEIAARQNARPERLAEMAHHEAEAARWEEEIAAEERARFAG